MTSLIRTEPKYEYAVGYARKNKFVVTKYYQTFGAMHRSWNRYISTHGSRRRVVGEWETFDPETLDKNAD